MTDIYYDPFDFAIDEDPYPIWKRMRDEQPLYYNEKYDFYALTRWDDVEAGLKDFGRLISGKGTILELIKSGAPLPVGMVIFEDPPTHEVYRGLLSRVFTPKKMLAIEPQVRKFCADCLDPFVGEEGFDFVRDLGAKMPMRVIGMLLGIPEDAQQAIRDHIDDGLRLESGEMPDVSDIEEVSRAAAEGSYGEYLDWRAEHPSNDLMSDLLQAEFEDHLGVRRRLTRVEVLGYVRLLSSAGNETTTKLISWTGKTLSDFPDQRRKIVADRSLIPNAIEEVLRFEAPSPTQSRYVNEDVEYHGRTVPAGSAIMLLNASANRDDRKWGNGDTFDVERKIDHHLSFGYGLHFCLGAALARLEGRVAARRGHQALPRLDRTPRPRRAGSDVDRPGLGQPPRHRRLSRARPAITRRTSLKEFQQCHCSTHSGTTASASSSSAPPRGWATPSPSSPRTPEPRWSAWTGHRSRSTASHPSASTSPTAPRSKVPSTSAADAWMRCSRAPASPMEPPASRRSTSSVTVTSSTA